MIKSDLHIETTISITEKNQKETAYSELFKKVEYVKLQTSADVLIKDISKICLAKDKIYVLDARVKALFVFNTHGEFLWKIHRLGSGPQEYTDLMDIDVDESTNRLYLFNPYKKILSYDLDGNFVKEDPLRITGTSFAKNDKHLLIYTCNIPAVINNRTVKSQLLIFDPTGKKLCGDLSLGDNNLIGNCKMYEFSNSFFSIQR